MISKTHGVLCFLLFMLVIAPVTLQAQGPRNRGPRGPFGSGPNPMQSGPALLNLKEVREELAIRDEQQKPLDEVQAQLQSEVMKSMEGFDFFGMAQLSEEERQSQMDKMRRNGEALTADAEKKVAAILDAQQYQRLKQLKLQQAGVTPFTRPEIAEQLQLDNLQRQQIKEIEERSRPRFEFGPPNFGRLERQRSKAITDVQALLSDSQKEKWAAMTGAAFKFPQQPQFGGPGGPGRRGGRGFGGPGGPKRELLKKFDKENNGWLNQEERKAARESIANEPAGGRRGFGRRGRGGPGGRGTGGRGNREAPSPGLTISPEEVTSYPVSSLFEPTVLRTLFLDFENEDWEAELESFHGSDVEVPATLTVDGKKYPQVGVHFRGMSSYMMVPTGHKRSLNLSLDFVEKKQRLYGYKTLNLLNCSGDPSLMSTALYSHIARDFIAVPKCNFVRVVINGENWGVYANVQQFNKVFLSENFNTSKGTRWKVRGNPGGDGGLRYLGEELGEYKSRFQMKSNGGEAEWNSLVELCRILNETPLDQLETALEPLLDIDGALKFLALDVALINSDGYWTRASDYTIFRNEAGRFHIIPHDMNEAFHAAGGHGPPGFGRSRRGRGRQRGNQQRGGRPRDDQRRPEERAGRFGPPGPPPGERANAGGGGKFDLDPLVGIDNPRFPLRSRLLAVPKLRAKYLEYIQQIAEKSLDWNNLGPVIAQYRELIKDEVQADTKKLASFDAFEQATSPEIREDTSNQGRGNSLRTFAEQRRKHLLEYTPPK